MPWAARKASPNPVDIIGDDDATEPRGRSARTVDVDAVPPELRDVADVVRNALPKTVVQITQKIIEFKESHSLVQLKLEQRYILMERQN